MTREFWKTDKKDMRILDHCDHCKHEWLWTNCIDIHLDDEDEYYGWR